MTTSLTAPLPPRTRRGDRGALRRGIAALTLGTCLATGLVTVTDLAAAPAASAAAVSDTLANGGRLDAGQRITSPSGRYSFTMQGDGNAVVYTSAGVALWSTRTDGTPGSVLVNQGDGNVVVYAPGNRAVWSSGTAGRGAARLVMQDDGNLVAYTGSVATWASGTVQTAVTPLRQRIVDTASAEVGAARSFESGTNCNYYSGQVSSWAGGCGNGRKSEAWCAQFVRWVLARAGASNGGMDAAANSVRSYGTWRAGSALTGVAPGDLIGFRLATGTPDDDHVGIVVAVSGNTITTVEGNSSDKVSRNTWVRGNTQISGYAVAR